MTDKPTTEPTTPPAAAPVPNADSSGQPAGDPTWLPERLERAKSSAVNSLLKELGFDKADDLKALLSEAKTAKEATLTESQKTQAALEKANKSAAEYKQQLADLTAARVTDRVDGALKDAATAAGAKKLAHVLRLIRDEHADKVAALVSDDGTVNEKAAEKLVGEFRAANPDYFGGTGGPGSPSNRGGKAVNPEDALKKALEGKRLFKL